jgi:hypothetical protein
LPSWFPSATDSIDALRVVIASPETVPKNWRFVACFLAIFTAMNAAHYAAPGNEAAQPWIVIAVCLSVYGLVHLVWRDQVRRGHGVQ